MKKITIIGGAGFVGSNLCTALAARQVDFEIIDLKPSKRFPEKSKIADVRDIDSLRKNISGTTVINLAAVHRDDIKNKDEYYQTNVLGARNIAKICSEKSIKKIIFTSSVAVYGFARGRIDEQGDVNPFNEYGRTKFEAEQEFQSWRRRGDNDLIIIRPTVIFGEGNRGNVFNLLSQIASGRFLMVGNGNNKKSMAYVGNVTAFIEKCLDTKVNYGLYNYVDTPDLQMTELVSYVRKALKNKNSVGVRIPYPLGLLVGYLADFLVFMTGRRLPVSSLRVRKFTASTEFASSKNQLDSFVPPYTLLEGLDRTLNSEFINPDTHQEIFYTE